MDKEQLPKINKIEIDEKTSEPVIVEVPLEELPEEPQVDDEERLLEESIRLGKEYEGKDNKEIGKQLVMTRFMGITKENNDINKKQKLFKNIFTIVFIVFVVGVLAYTFYTDFFAPANKDRVFPTWESVREVFFNSWYYMKV